MSERDPASEIVTDRNRSELVSLGRSCLPGENFEYPVDASVKKLKFQSTWYCKWAWLEYSVSRDAIYCFPCRIFGSLGELIIILHLNYAIWDRP